MKNKKGQETDIPKVIVQMAILLLILFIVISIITGIWIPQFLFAGEKSEEATLDCDEDTIYGIMDKCPCDPKIQEVLPRGETCGKPTPEAEENCPKLCKRSKK